MQRVAAKSRREFLCQAATLKTKLPFKYVLAIKLNVVYDKTSWTLSTIHQVIHFGYHVTGVFRVIRFCIVFLNRLNVDFLIFKGMLFQIFTPFYLILC